MFLRIILFAIGISVLSTGISTLTNASLGTGTISALPLVISRYTGVTMGIYVIAINLFFYVVQSLIDSRDRLKRLLLQVPTCFLFGAIIDVTMPLIAMITPEGYWSHIAMSFIGAAVIGLGVALMVRASVTVLPPEGVILSVMHRWGGSFGTLRIVLDLALVISAVIVSYILLGYNAPVREGTLIGALCAGPCAQRFIRMMSKKSA